MLSQVDANGNTAKHTVQPNESCLPKDLENRSDILSGLHRVYIAAS